MLIGYARTSTTEQEAGLEAQLRDPDARGLRVGVLRAGLLLAPRAELEAALKFAHAEATR